MNLKKTWNKAYGKSAVITKENSAMNMIEVDMLRLSDGRVKKYSEKDKEYGIVILGGSCNIVGDGFEYNNIGKRRDVFDGPATCVYVPRNTEFTITAVGEVSLAVSKSPSKTDHKPVLVKPEDVIIKDLGILF